MAPGLAIPLGWLLDFQAPRPHPKLRQPGMMDSTIPSLLFAGKKGKLESEKRICVKSGLRMLWISLEALWWLFLLLSAHLSDF